MSALASSLPAPSDIAATRIRRGPTGACAVYGPGDKEDWIAVDALRREHSWQTARAIVHEQLNLGALPDQDKFRYHWRGRCACWSDDLKAWIEAQS
jgi:hypothetical protein